MTSRNWLGGVLFVLMLVVVGCGSAATDGADAGSATGETAASGVDAATDDDATTDDDASTDDDATAAGDTEATTGDASDEQPTVVVTTNILGDVVANLLAGQAEVVTIMPVGADPHDFQASAREVAQMLEADALIVNGADFEEGLLDVINSAVDDGVPTFEAISVVETAELQDDDQADHGDDHDDHDDHSDDHDDPDDDHAHDHDGTDPHFFVDPVRMVAAVEGIGAFLADELDGLDLAALELAVAAYSAELSALNSEVEALVEDIPAERRVLVTNHEVFGYFADRYGFEVVGAVIPGGSTAEGVSAGALADLADVVRDEGVPAIFADTSASTTLAETLAAEVGEVQVVELYTESLGEAGSDGATYIGMVRANATRINQALA